MAGPVLQVDDFSSMLTSGRQGSDAERMYNDSGIEAELLCILLHELLHGASRQMIRLEAIIATTPRCRHWSEERSVTIVLDACNVDPMVQPFHGFDVQRDYSFLPSFAIDCQDTMLAIDAEVAPDLHRRATAELESALRRGGVGARSAS